MKRVKFAKRRIEQGQLLLHFGLILGFFLLGFVGLATDYTNFWYHRQAVQSAADATCQAGAMDLFLLAGGSPTRSWLTNVTSS